MPQISKSQERKKSPLFQRLAKKINQSPPRIRAIILVVSVFLILAIILLPISLIIMEFGSLQLEMRDTREQTQQAIEFINNEITDLDQKVVDWAYWDDTYKFAQDLNADYIGNNLQVTSLVNLQINMYLLVDMIGKTILTTSVDLDEVTHRPTLSGTDKLISEYPTLIDFPTSQDSNIGIVLLPEQVLMVASRLVLSSREQGPSPGVLIFGRYLDESELAINAKVTNLSIKMQRLDQENLPLDFQIAKENIEHQSGIYVRPLDKDRIAGYACLNDINDKPAVILRIDSPRDIYKEGQKNQLMLILLFLMAGLVLCLVGQYALEKYFSYQAVVQQASEAIMLVDKDKHIVDMNSACERMLDISFKETTVLTLQDILENPTEIDQDYKPDDSHNYIPIGERLLKKKDGSTLIAEMSASNISFGRQRILSILMRDITERKKMENMLLASQKFADLGTLAAGIAHELNSPLQVITGVSESLLNRLNDGEVDLENCRTNLNMINRNGWRCAHIIRSLITYARPKVDQIEPNDINELINNTLLLIEHQLKSWKNIHIITELGEKIPPLICDRNQIIQVIINLLVNARDAMPGGGQITVRSWYDSENKHIKLQVSDNGSGIPKEIADRIFDPFFTTKSIGQGTGLGLSIVKGIVKAHDGKISVESDPHVGTIFTLIFPEIWRQETPSIINNNKGKERFDDTI